MFSEQTKWRKGSSTNGAAPEKLRQKYCMKYE